VFGTGWAASVVSDFGISGEEIKDSATKEFSEIENTSWGFTNGCEQVVKITCGYSWLGICQMVGIRNTGVKLFKYQKINVMKKAPSRILEFPGSKCPQNNYPEFILGSSSPTSGKVGILFKNHKRYCFLQRHKSLFTQSTENSTPHNIRKLKVFLPNPRFIYSSIAWCVRALHINRDIPLKANSHIPCRSAKGLDCVFPSWFTQCGRVWFTHAMPFPCHATTMPFWKRPLKATAQRGMRAAWYVWISIGRPEAACGRPARVRLFPATTRSSTKVLSRSRLAVRIFPSTTRTFTKETALSENGKVAAWHVWINAAWERHGVCVN
jgi:hypothetical protein